jgi:hypothetical protein
MFFLYVIAITTPLMDHTVYIDLAGEIIHVEDGGNRGDGWMEIYFRGRDDVRFVIHLL